MPNLCDNFVRVSVGTKDSPDGDSGKLDSGRVQSLIEETSELYGVRFPFYIGPRPTSIVSNIDDRVIILQFTTAWKPYFEVCRHLERAGYEVQALYYEGGMCFGGVYVGGKDYCMSNVDSVQHFEMALTETLGKYVPYNFDWDFCSRSLECMRDEYDDDDSYLDPKCVEVNVTDVLEDPNDIMKRAEERLQEIMRE